MVDFLNKLESSDQKYRTNGNVRDKSYNVNFLFNMREFVLFGTYHQSMYFTSTIFLK